MMSDHKNFWYNSCVQSMLYFTCSLYDMYFQLLERRKQYVIKTNLCIIMSVCTIA